MSDKFVEPQLLPEDGVSVSMSALAKVTRKKPATFKIIEAELDARLADYLELCEQAFIAGWTDCEEKITSKSHKTDAYYNGYYQCMKFEGNRDE